MANLFTRYFSGVQRALTVKSGAGGIHAEGALAAGEIQRLGQVIPGAKAEIIAAALAITQEGVMVTLKATPLADLKAFGATIGPLQTAGFQTIADLAGHTEASLQNYRGVGEVTAEAAIKAFNTFQDSARAHVRLLPDPDNRRVADTRLLVAIARYETLLRQAATRIDEVTTRQAYAQAELALLKRQTQLSSHLFSVGAQEQLERDTQKLSGEFTWITSEARILNQYARTLVLDPADVWKRYAENAATLIALLESVLPARAMAPGALAGPDMRGGLPAEIADAVEATKLDATLLLATLRRYQQFGAQYIICQKRVLLGDDMGLGKTVQVLAAMCHLAAQGKTHFFVVAPNSVLINWEREVKKHTKLSPIIIHGFDRDDELEQWRREGGVGITTFTTLTRLVEKIGALDLLAVDEAHSVKNPGTQRTQAVMQLTAAAEYVAFMSGTALENRLSELNTLITTVQPELKGEISMLLLQVRPAPAEVRLKLAPVYLRRTQADVLSELPDLTETDELIPLEPADTAAYQACPDNLMNKRLAATIGAGGQQSAKYDRLREILENYEADGRKVAVFSFFRQVLDDVSTIVGGCPQIHGAVSSEERQAILDRFAAKEGYGVLALQIEAGGVGINLQCAQVVILMEPQFKPSTERQAIARVRRMGQTRKVNAHRLIAQGTIDEMLVKLIVTKAKLFEDYAQHSDVKDASGMAVDGGSAAIEAELRAMIAKG